MFLHSLRYKVVKFYTNFAAHERIFPPPCKGIDCPHCGIRLKSVDVYYRCQACNKQAIVYNPTIKGYIVERRHY